MSGQPTKVIISELNQGEENFFLVQSYFDADFFSVAPTFDEALEKFRRFIFEKLPDGFHSILTTNVSLKGKRFREKSAIWVPENSLPESILKSWQEFQNRFEELKLKASIPMPPKPKLLLHVCCGPDAAGVIGQLKDDYDLVGFWYDPNIQPEEEYVLRREAFAKVASLEQLPWIEGEYDVDRFYKHIEGLETTPETGAKCSLCYDFRLERAARAARDESCTYFATTLAISPHKVQQKLLRFGELSGSRFGVRYVHRNFMKSDKFKESVTYTEEHNIYRQDYCGCFFSLHEGGPKARKMAEKLSLRKEDMEQANWRNPFLNIERAQEHEKNSTSH